MLSEKRDGPLKMGGTYWYYYEVDGDTECHNPLQPSTTLCPLLPGQNLNVLEVPREGRSRSNSIENSSAFTRNPKDRYLTPVPPNKPLPSPRPRSANREAYALPLPSPWAPKSATYPPANANQFLSPNVSRHTRSASASPLLPSTPLLTDFKDLKEKFASKRLRSRSRSSSDVREMQISAPVLISTTADGVLSPRQSTPPQSPRNFSRPQRFESSIPTITKGFSPLASHPVDQFTDVGPFIAELPANETTLQRRRSYVPPSIVRSEFDVEPGRLRANSTDTRRTKRSLYSNDPWVSSPRFKHEFDSEIQSAREVQFFKPAPVLKRPVLSLNQPATNERPSSSYGGSRNPTLRDTPLAKDRPTLSQYPTPSLLFACHAFPIEEKIPVEEEEDDDALTNDILSAYGDEEEEEPIAQMLENQRSHFSTWSSFDSYVTSDDDGVASPIFSSASSVSSYAGSPMRQTTRYSFDAHAFTKARLSTTISEVDEEDLSTNNRISTPPQLDLNGLRLSTVSFGSDLFNLDIQHSEALPRRQAACFGMGFQGYSLPEDDSKSKETIQSDITLRAKRVSVHRESSTSQLNMLMDDFSYLGDAVV